MEEEKCGVLTPLEVCRMIEYLHSVGLTEVTEYPPLTLKGNEKRRGPMV